MLFTLFIIVTAPIIAFGWPEEPSYCDTCETVTKIEKVTNRLNPLLEPIEKYLQEHQLKNEHQVLKNLLLDFGAEIADKLDNQRRALENYIVSVLSNESNNTTVIMENYITELLERKFHELMISIRPPPSDCLDILRYGETQNGVYTIYQQGLKVKVLCDMETDGGGWTVFLLRQNQTIQQDFRKDWNEYRWGFGIPPNEYWMGNEALHRMTSSKKYSIRIEASHPNGSPTNVWSEYSNFRVGSEETKYRLTLTGRNQGSTIYGKGVYNLNWNNGMKFTTIDQDNDEYSGAINCANHKYGGDGNGFWYKHCSYINPTRSYGKILFFKWSTTDSRTIFATRVELKIRPKI